MTDTQYPGTLYDYAAGHYCGVLVTERVMRKLAASQAKHTEEVKRILSDNKSEIFPSSWTLHYPDGVQTAVYFIDTGKYARTVDESIKAALRHDTPRARFPVFYASSMDEAAKLADARHEAEADPC